MITKVINRKEYSIPQSWDEITLDKVIKVSRDSEEFRSYSGVTEHFKMAPEKVLSKFSLVSGYCDIDIKDLKKMTTSEAVVLFKQLKFLSEDIPVKDIKEFEFGGDKYYVTQNLRESEFQDHVSIELVLQMHENNMYEALPMLAAIICKRKGESLDDYDLEERSELFKGLPVTIANSIAVFFYAYEKISRVSSQLYSNPEEAVEARINSTLDTMSKPVGRGLLSRLLISILRIYLKYLRRNVKKSLSSIRSKYSTGSYKRTSKRMK